ncbi:Uncharacterized protein PBTT_01512 [Plasmodiophora brassicae]|uniref:Uncharacterized protein n=1 Tax=Plasmodiophora brassicae TaxID=37360 RepID=A0A0G4II54_PLABS|nr:hypothetical protein PBRA_003729 [Plasmodiophora brassicae]SPQ94249.1 unnamed protein product [Plasmodiophora brassicae]
MSEIIEAGCHVMLWLGLLDPRSCEFVSPSGILGVNSPFWLKVLAGPTLVLSILIIVLLEDICLRSKVERPPELEPLIQLPTKKPSKRRREPRRAVTAVQLDQRGEPDVAPETSSESDTLRLIICDGNTGEESCYRITWTCPLRNVVEIHCKGPGRDGSCDDPRGVSLRRQGRLLNLDKCPRYLDLMDLDKLDLEINYQSLYESAANVLWRARAKFNEELQEKITALAAAQAKASELAQQLEHEQSSTQTLHRTIDDQNATIESLKECRETAKEAEARSARTQRLYATEKAARLRVEKDIQTLQEQLETATSLVASARRRGEADAAASRSSMSKLRSELKAAENERNMWRDEANQAVRDRDEALNTVAARERDLQARATELSECRSALARVQNQAKEAESLASKFEALNLTLQQQLQLMQKKYQQLTHKQHDAAPSAAAVVSGAATLHPGTNVRSSSPTNLPSTTALSSTAVAAPISRPKAISSGRPAPSGSKGTEPDWIHATRGLATTGRVQPPLLIIDDGNKAGGASLSGEELAFQKHVRRSANPFRAIQ